MRRICILLLAGAAMSAVYGQTPAVAPAFEVASIKLAPPLDMAKIQAGQMPHVGQKIDGARVDIGYFTVRDLFMTAYKLKAFYLFSGPAWMNGDRWDVAAKMPEGATKEQVPDMLKQLLADRFKLTLHHETKEAPVYALLVAKGGAKVKESTPEKPVDPDAKEVPLAKGENAFKAGDQEVRTDGKGGATIKGGEMGTIKVLPSPGGGMHMEVAKMSMTDFAFQLSVFIGKPVVDMTELKGTYELSLDFSREDMAAAAAAAGVSMPAPPPPPGGDATALVDNSGSSVFTTIQKLGLRLESRKAPIDIMIIDHVEKTPTDN